MNIFSKIKQIDDLTNSERVVANYILEYPQEVIESDIKELSNKCYVSVSTIYRFIDKLELQGFSQLKLLISSQILEYQDEQKNTDYNYPFKKSDTLFQITTKMSSLYEQTIISTKNLLDLDILLNVIQSLDKAHHIVMLPSSGNVNIAQNFQLNMKEIGKQVDVETIPYLQYLSSLSMTENDVAIVISYANRGTAMLDIMKELHKHHVTIILISSTLPSDLFAYATYHLFFCPYESIDKKIASFTSRISLQYLLDILFACYFNRHYQENMAFKNKIKKTL